jgi:seryl-tRNA synthetase
MLDIRWIRDNPEALDRALQNRGQEPASASLIALDETRRATIGQLERLQAARNAASKEIGRAKAEKDEATAAKLVAEVATLKDRTAELEAKAKDADKALEDALAIIPNVPQDDVPVGADEKANVEYRRWGEPPNQRLGWGNAFKPKEHYELGEALRQMDFETAAKLSGSRFVVLKKGLARLERALGQFMIELHTEEHGYTEVQPPLLVRDEVLFGTGQLPKAAEDMFLIAGILDQPTLRRIWELRGSPEQVLLPAAGNGQDQSWAFDLDQLPRIFVQALVEVLTKYNRWLIPTAEVPLTNLVRESILSEEELPLRFTALTPCFRSEAGAAGKDTRGMLRQHQFNKVELVSVTTPEQSKDEHERMLACAEEVLKRLDLHHRTMVLSTGDMGFASQKTYDIEVWLPGQGAFREISSCSICGDFQARRMQARYRPKAGDGGKQKPPRLVHTLNGSGVAVGRALIAVMENYQNPDGSITVPDALRPYMRGVERIAG